MSGRFEQSQRRRQGVDGQYQGWNWQLSYNNRFELEVPDPDGGEPESKSFDTYVQLCEYVEREIAASAKRYVCNLPVVMWATGSKHSDPDHIDRRSLTGINRTSSRVSAKGGEVRARYILPDVPAMAELLEMYAEQAHKLNLIERMCKQFEIEAVKLLEAEYAEKKAAAYEFDPGAELRMALEGFTL